MAKFNDIAKSGAKPGGREPETEARAETPAFGYPHNRAMAAALQKCLEKTFAGRPPANVRTIVMLSGGLDSIALLGTVLKETNHAVHAHHIEIVNFENRCKVEKRSVANALKYIRKHYRPFDYSESRSEFNVGKGGGTDLQLSLFTAFRLCTALGGNIDLVMTGHITPPFWELSEGAAVFHAGFIHKRRKPEWVWPLKFLASAHVQKKLDIYESIPEELAETAWSCRKPVVKKSKFLPCGQCFACKSMIEIKRIRAGRTDAGAGGRRPG
ncbi:MAG: hypothetical protein EXQ86_07445 [Rhodospirillales bacterium]|nr:hypothetical protein [Rhodospirillales bacterium]